MKIVNCCGDLDNLIRPSEEDDYKAGNKISDRDSSAFQSYDS